jgi:uncharacterized membrane protein YfcA
MNLVLDLLTPDYFVAVAVVVAAGLMRGFAGFGSGMLMAPIFAVLFGPVDTVAIIILMETCVTVQLIPSVFGEIEWRFVAPMGAAAALFMPVGSWMLVSIDPSVMSRVIAAIVFVFAVILMAGWRYGGGKRMPVTLGIGAVSGTMMAATSLANPPVMLYLLSGPDRASSNRANVTAYFAITLTMMLALMTFAGLMSWPAVWQGVTLVPPFMLTAWLGSRLFRRSGESLYRWTSLVLLLIAGAYGLLR